MDQTITIRLPSNVATQLLDALFVADLVAGAERSRKAHLRSDGAVPQAVLHQEHREHQRIRQRLAAVERALEALVASEARP